MESKLFTPKERYHIASTVCTLFFILAVLNLLIPQWLVQAYSFGVVILFGYVAARNWVKINVNTDNN